MRKKIFFLKYITPQQAKSLLILLLILLIVQASYWLLIRYYSQTVTWSFKQEETLRLQRRIDSAQQELAKKKNQLKPFNPNFITDEKGHFLEMSLEEIDRLHAFRAQDKYVNSPEEFQQVTQVSDAWLQKYSPYFKFPDWVNKRNSSATNHMPRATLKLSTTDINKATKEDLMQIRGIGEVFAQRILDEREKFQGFVSMKQLEHIHNISPEAVRELKRNFRIQKISIQKININTASVEQLSKLPYLNSHFARQIVILRSKQSEPLQIEDIKKINGFPIEKLEIIALYLEF